MTSKSTWVIATAISTVEVGLLFRKFYKKEIDFKYFAIASGIKIGASLAGIAGGAGEAAVIGATVGTLIFPGMGSVIGGIIGGIIGGTTSGYYAEKYLLEKFL